MLATPLHAPSAAQEAEGALPYTFWIVGTDP
jgi:hypothetical protein